MEIYSQRIIIAASFVLNLLLMYVYSKNRYDATTVYPEGKDLSMDQNKTDLDLRGSVNVIPAGRATNYGSFSINTFLASGNHSSGITYLDTKFKRITGNDKLSNSSRSTSGADVASSINITRTDQVFPERLVYNRMPKCGSMTVSTVVRQLGRRNNFRVVISDVYDSANFQTHEEEVGT